MKKLFGLPKFLTARDEWAGTFEWLWEERTTPRTDCPTTLPPIAGTPAELRKQQEVVRIGAGGACCCSCSS